MSDWNAGGPRLQVGDPGLQTPYPAAGWYPDPSCSGALRYWTGAEWSEVTAPQPAAALGSYGTYGQAWSTGYAPIAQPTGWGGAPDGRGERRWGAVLLGLGLVALALTIAIGAWGAGDFTRSVRVTARVVEVDDGWWCTYDWEGPPTPLAGSDSDACPDGAEVGQSVDIIVDPDGTAWTSYDDKGSGVLSAVLVGLQLSASLIAPGVWLRRRGVALGSTELG